MTADVGQIYVDANGFIDLIEGTTDRATELASLFAAAGRNVGLFVTSEITFAEVLAPSREFGARSPDLQERYLRVLRSATVNLRPVSRSVLMRTVSLRETMAFKLPDAIHYATALEAGCRAIVSRDRGFDHPASTLAVVDGPTAVRALTEALLA